MKKSRTLFIFYLLSFICLALLPVEAAEHFTQLTQDNGLSSRRCFSICQDKNGFIWIATKLSIDRYDGQNYKHYEILESKQRPSGDIGFKFVWLSPDSTLWAFTQSGNLFRYDETSDSFSLIYSIYDYFQSYKAHINDIFFESPQTLLLATTQGVLRLDIQQKKAVSYELPQELNVYQIIKENDYYYLATKTGLYVVRFSGENRAQIVKQWLKDCFVNRVWYDATYRRFWIGTVSDGLYILSQQPNETAPHPLGLTAKPIRAIIPYNEQLLAIGADGDGILLVNRQTMELEQKMAQNEIQDYSLPSNSIWDLMIDRQQILWVVTFHAGVSHSDSFERIFRSFVHEKMNPQSISNNYINAALEDSDGDLWFGTNNGVSFLNRRNGQWKHFFRTDSVQSKENVILTLCEIDKGKIGAGGYAFGIAEIDKQSGNVKRYNAQSPITKTNYVFDIYKDEYSGNIWTGGLYGPINCYNPQTHQSRSYQEESVRCFQSYDSTTILLGLFNGLYLMDTRSGEKRQTRIASAVNDILNEGGNRYWIGTKVNGLYYYDLKTDSLRQFTKADGLSSNYVYAILKDEQGDLWVSTEDGLNRLSPQTGKIVQFSKSNGLISDQFVPHASARCATNELLFGSEDGAILFYPPPFVNTYKTDNYNLSFTDFQLFGISVGTGEKGSPLESPIDKTKRIALPYNRNYFSIAYALPNYQSFEKVSYSYFLKGHDFEWSSQSQTSMANYSKIEPGHYTFFVRAYIDQQLQEERSIQIVVCHPWWNTLGAWICYALVLLVAAYYLFKYFSTRRKKIETQEKMDFFTNTANDLLTPLNLIEAPLKDMSLIDIASEEVRYLLSIALNNTQKLSHFVHQLIDFQRIALQTEQLIVNRHNLRHFFIYKLNTYKTIASQKFVTLDLHLPDKEWEIFFDKDKVNKILDNILSNAIKYTPFGGKIEIMVYCFDDHWSFIVKDTGMGIQPRNRKLIFRHIFRDENEINTQYTGSGIGLKMAAALVRIHQGKISYTGKTGEGSEFTVTLPYAYDDKYKEVSSIPAEIVPEEIASSDMPDKARILIVESEPEMLSYLNSAFSKLYKTVTLATGTDAFSQIPHFKPELIIVGAYLSDMDGLSFCSKIKDNPDATSIPVLMIVEVSDNENQRKIFASGAYDFICKPFEMDILKSKTANILSLQSNCKNRMLAELKNNNLSAVNNNRDQEFMNNLILLIENNISNQELTANLLCKEMGLSRTLFYNRITQMTGSPPNEFIRNIRLKNAADLLMQGKYSVAEVASMVGIDNPKYFSRVFKNYYHVSPKDYLK